MKLVRDPKSSSPNRTNGYYNEIQDKLKMKTNKKKNYELVMKQRQKKTRTSQITPNDREKQQVKFVSLDEVRENNDERQERKFTEDV